MITIDNVRELDLEQIADSGQCFRWQRIDENCYRIIAKGKVLLAFKHRGSNSLRLDCSADEYEKIWRGYLDMDTDYGSIISSIPAGDLYLKNAAAAFKGIRILRQDPWETLITFIISQRKNIPAIKASVEKLCSIAGPVIGYSQDEDFHAFPTPKALAALSEEDLKACSLGYRTPYIQRAARAVLDGTFDPYMAFSLPDEELFDKLCSLHGVGKKVANCTMLFAYHRMDSFPIDVWMERIRDRHYPEGFNTDSYRPWGGVMQQYMFAYERLIGQDKEF
ncbi:DNA-3-methyladenine glycosylase family protein [Butyrivibrio sp. MC2013]|uniref:DNA-3-methyladenine glycosylase family protein n=1 Tax=Butyrivibrio sp. MC2013 TaxID=1280686 RepID=UPI00041FAE1F|nr:DNA glycosylase [Butyrivibrio sp. MC2013]